MHIEQANRTDLPAILKKIGLATIKHKGDEIWYYSPFRKKRTAGLHVNKHHNTWYDTCLKKGGKVMDFVRAYLQYHEEDHTPADILRWLDNMSVPDPLQGFPLDGMCDKDLMPHNVYPLANATLAAYLTLQGIPLPLAKLYLKEIHAHNPETGHDFYTVGMVNLDGGYEMRNELFKGCLGIQTISFFRGATYPPSSVHVFEDMTDFLAALASQKINRFEGDAIILHKLSCLPQAVPYIKNYPCYKAIHSWMSNSPTGKDVTHSLKMLAAQEGLVFKAMNNTYLPFQSVSIWHRQNYRQ